MTRPRTEVAITMTLKGTTDRAPWADLEPDTLPGVHCRTRSDIELVESLVVGDLIVASRKDELLRHGVAVTVDHDNRFRARATSTLDIVGYSAPLAIAGGAYRIEDTASSVPTDGDITHLQICIAALTHHLDGRHRACIIGRINSADGRYIEISLQSIDEIFLAHTSSLLNEIVRSDLPSSNPRYAYCRFCEVAASSVQFHQHNYPVECWDGGSGLLE